MARLSDLRKQLSTRDRKFSFDRECVNFSLVDLVKEAVVHYEYNDHVSPGTSWVKTKFTQELLTGIGMGDYSWYLIANVDMIRAELPMRLMIHHLKNDDSYSLENIKSVPSRRMDDKLQVGIPMQLRGQIVDFITHFRLRKDEFDSWRG